MLLLIQVCSRVFYRRRQKVRPDNLEFPRQRRARREEAPLDFRRLLQRSGCLGWVRSVCINNSREILAFHVTGLNRFVSDPLKHYDTRVSNLARDRRKICQWSTGMIRTRTFSSFRISQIFLSLIYPTFRLQ